ncbi:hypothetical protein E2C01_076835 [Portunus trituberculatus]|uniref:Uncharacterized protein n=1 Tax=Portunus trituberculatus TaxID=210409 RepID=A0A5B7IKP6_PORTR|nr:hypothetical protein [Portunus trituberculatus]
MYPSGENNLNVLRDDGMRRKEKQPVWSLPSLSLLPSLPSLTVDSGSREVAGRRECTQGNAWSTGYTALISAKKPSLPRAVMEEEETWQAN